MGNPFADYLSNKAASIQAQYDAKYQDDLKNFNEGCASYQERAQRQYDVDGTVIPPPQVPVKKTCTLVDYDLVEGTWKDPNLHSPVFTPMKTVPSSGLPDISKAVTLDQVASMLVLIMKRLGI